MSIQTELTRITNAKAAIKTAIEGKGVTVPNGTLLDGMASLIESIEAGSGGAAGGAVVAYGEITPASDTTTITIEHNIGAVPDFFAIWGDVEYPAENYNILLLDYRNRPVSYNSRLNVMIKSKDGSSYKYGDAENANSYSQTVAPFVFTEQNAVLTTASIGKGPNNAPTYFRSGVAFKWIAVYNGGMNYE